MTEVAEGLTAGVGESRADVDARGHVPGESSMWFFVIGDLLIFGVYFVGYMYFRGQDHDVFLRSQARLNLDIGAINTVVLLTSSLFVALGTAAARAGNTADAVRLFGHRAGLRGRVPTAQAVRVDSRDHRRPDAGHKPVLHVLLRDDRHAPVPCLHSVWSSCASSSATCKTSAKPKMSFVETGATYWHMVDVLWLVLFALLYLMR